MRIRFSMQKKTTHIYTHTIFIFIIKIGLLKDESNKLSELFMVIICMIIIFIIKTKNQFKLIFLSLVFILLVDQFPNYDV